MSSSLRTPSHRAVWAAAAGGSPVGSVFLNSAGTFATNATAVGNGEGHNLTGVAAGDFDGDGKTDLAFSAVGYFNNQQTASTLGSVNDGVWPPLNGGGSGGGGGGGGEGGPAVALAGGHSAASLGGVQPVFIGALPVDLVNGTVSWLPSPSRHRGTT